MAKTTLIDLRQQVIYSIYVRNHTQEGTFKAVIKDLDRIQKLGADILWFMPIHPIGKKNRKGTLGCPYAIQDYRKVNPEYGTLEDFKELVEEIHKRKMKCMIDVVYNHTSPDSWLVEHHPEYFYRKPDGSMGTKTGDWTDVADLDYQNRELWKYQIETLCMWAELVDGFRCDVASLVPLDFWLMAREAVEKVHPGFIWLAETIEPGFVRDNRKRRHTALSDGEIYQAFDISYDYDIHGVFLSYLNGKRTLKEYVEFLNYQDAMYPDNYVKLRFLENHDQTRAKAKFPDEYVLKNWTAFMYFQKGSVLLYGGQETENTVSPSLFEKDKVDWNTGKNLALWLRKLYDIKKLPIMRENGYELTTDKEEETIIGRYIGDEELLIGLFCAKRKKEQISMEGLEVPDGEYENLMDGKKVFVQNSILYIDELPVIFWLKR